MMVVMASLADLPQSWATIIGAMLVLVGVRWTMLENRRKARQEHLEERAARQHELLKGLYGEFAAAEQNVLFRHYMMAHTVKHLEEEKERGVSVEGIVKLFEEQRQALHESIKVPLALSGKIQILDDANKERRKRMRLIEFAIRRLGSEDTGDVTLKRIDDMSAFNYYVRHSLEEDYQTAVGLAKNGFVPPKEIELEKGSILADWDERLGTIWNNRAKGKDANS